MNLRGHGRKASKPVRFTVAQPARITSRSDVVLVAAGALIANTRKREEDRAPKLRSWPEITGGTPKVQPPGLPQPYPAISHVPSEVLATAYINLNLELI
jgi:hypothetical protein